MFKKTLATIALTVAIAVMAPQAASAEEAALRYEGATTEATVEDQDVAATKAVSDIEQRLVEDPLLARQLQYAASTGDTTVLSKLLGSDGVEVVAVDSYESTELTSPSMVTSGADVYVFLVCGEVQCWWVIVVLLP